jgi:molybdopterin synthase sulfur carrier subunit
MEIKFYATLRSVVGGPTVQLEDVSEITVGQMLQEFYTRFPAIHSQLTNNEGELHSGIHILINGRDMRYLDGLETVVTVQDEVRIFPPVGGGIE